MTTTQHNPALAALRHHVTGAIERGEAQAILEMRPSKRKQQHTEGPWEVRPSSNPKNGTAWRDIVSLGGVFSPSYVGEALEQDARLIAAAPLMLDALRAALQAIGDTYEARDNDEQGEMVRDIIAGAIAAATGEEIQP